MRHRVLGLLAASSLLAGAAGCTSGDDDETVRGGQSTETTAAEPADPLVVTTDLGPVRGVASDVPGVRAFHAMPYAAEPTGTNRWRPPQPRAPYVGTLDVTAPGGSCPQAPPADVALAVIPDAVEDCLTVSVWSPTGARGLPVLVWIHGGSLTGGSAEQPLYIGDELAADGAVVVGVNYRLGAFGFLATSEQAAETADASVGNFGFLDQVAALEWVRRNIAAFGGDPGNVTIFGQSAGGWSVCAHLASPRSAGLFAKAIVQSGCDVQQELDVALAAGDAYLRAVGCDDLACLRAQSTDRLLEPEFRARLVLDGVVITETAREVAARGGLTDIPVMIGSTADEGTLFTLGLPEPSTEALLAYAARWTDQPAALLALYPEAEYAANIDRLEVVLADLEFICSSLAYAEASASDTFVYHYTFDPGGTPMDVGATHGAELVPLFGHPEGITVLEPGLSGPVAALGDDMRAAWVRFAATGDPGELFEPYADDASIVVLDVPLAVTDDIRDGRCAPILELTGGATRGAGVDDSFER